jgi:thiosulfate/3-mercaptopyruvate sulfurtransferase
MKNFVDCTWLNDHLEDADVFVIDCRFDLFDASYGKAAYGRGHIKNAYYFDIDTDFSGEKKIHGGARPVPDLAVLGQKLEAIGVTMDSTLVCYDDRTYSSARAWWQFKYMGFKKVYILNGGYEAWRHMGLPVVTEPPAPRNGGQVRITPNNGMYGDIDYVKKAAGNPQIIHIDSREYRRYTGEYEPLYAKSGHIPGAVSRYWQELLNDDGTIKDKAALEEMFRFAKPAKEVLTSCGSGIDGAMNFVILDELGYKARLYVGSISDWISYEENTLESV